MVKVKEEVEMLALDNPMTLSVIGIVTAPFVAVVDESVIIPVYVPVPRPEGFTETVIIAGDVSAPDGVMLTQGVPSDVDTLALNANDGPLLETVMAWEAGTVPPIG